MLYSVDTSAILDGWVRDYPRDVFEGLWDINIDRLIEHGTLIATELVLDELEKKADEVHEWFREREVMFIEIDDKIQPVVTEILADHPKLIDERKSRTGADPFVIALAEIREDCCVVTGEGRTRSPNRPKIPDVCDARGVRWISFLELMREQGWTFIPRT